MREAKTKRADKPNTSGLHYENHARRPAPEFRNDLAVWIVVHPEAPSHASRPATLHAATPVGGITAASYIDSAR